MARDFELLQKFKHDVGPDDCPRRTWLDYDSSEDDSGGAAEEPADKKQRRSPPESPSGKGPASKLIPPNPSCLSATFAPFQCGGFVLPSPPPSIPASPPSSPTISPTPPALRPTPVASPPEQPPEQLWGLGSTRGDLQAEIARQREEIACLKVRLAVRALFERADVASFIDLYHAPRSLYDVWADQFHAQVVRAVKETGALPREAEAEQMLTRFALVMWHTLSALRTYHQHASLPASYRPRGDEIASRGVVGPRHLAELTAAADRLAAQVLTLMNCSDREPLLEAVRHAEVPMQLDPLWEGHLKVIYLECHDSACRKHSSTALDSGDHQYLDKLSLGNP